MESDRSWHFSCFLFLSTGYTASVSFVCLLFTIRITPARDDSSVRNENVLLFDARATFNFFQQTTTKSSNLVPTIMAIIATITVSISWWPVVAFIVIAWERGISNKIIINCSVWSSLNLQMWYLPSLGWFTWIACVVRRLVSWTIRSTEIFFEKLVKAHSYRDVLN